MTAILTAAPDLLLEADAITGLSDGASVTTWADGSGNGRDASGGTSPVYKTGVAPSGLAAVRFNGTSQYLTSSASTSASTQTVVAIVKHQGTGDRGFRGVSANGGITFRYNSDGTLGVDKGGITNIGNSLTKPPSGWHLVTMRIGGGVWDIRVDGTTVGGGSLLTSPDAGRTTTVGAYNPGGQFFNGDIALLASWSRSLSHNELIAIEAEQAAKWGTATPKGSITASTTTSGWPAAALVDGALGDSGVSWAASSSTLPAWTLVQFPEQRTVTSYTITARNSDPNAAPKNWTFEGSNDASTWTTLDTRTGEVFTANQAKSFTISNSTAYFYYRLNISAINLAAPNLPSYSEWEFGYAASLTFAGTVAATSAVEGAVSVVPALAGQVDATSTAEGAVSVTATLAGQSDAVSATQGSVTSTQNVAGQVDAVTAVEGVFTSGVSVSVSGQVDAVSDVEGDLSLTFLLGGRVDAVTGVEGDVTVSPGIAGEVDVVSGVQGSISLPVADEAESYTDSGTDVTEPVTLSLDTAESYSGTGTDAADPIAFEVDRIDAYAEAWATAYDSLDVALDPDTLRPQYRLKVVDRTGDVVCELADVQIGTATRALNGRGGLDFRLGKNDAQLASVPQFAEVQLWRGSHLVPGGWFTVVDPQIDEGGDMFDYQCSGLSYYFERRLIGAERPEMLRNGGFEEGARFWSFGWSPGSNAETPPTWEITSEALEGGKALRVFADDKVESVERTVETAAVFVPNSAAFLSGGEQAIRDQVADIPDGTHITVEGHTADADAGTGYALSVARAEAAAAVISAYKPTLVITTVGKGETEPVDPRHTEDAYRKNRRVVILADIVQTKVGHRQFAHQSFTASQPVSAREPLEFDIQGQGRIDEFEGPSKDGWMLYADVRKVGVPATILNNDHVDVDASTARQAWMGLNLTVKVPADGLDYVVDVRAYPTAGASSFDQMSAKPNLKLAFWDADPRTIIGGLVDHAQDATLGKSDLNIQAFGPLSGFTTSRSWEWKEAKPVGEAIDDMVRSLNGPDANIAVTPRRRLLVIHPKQGRSNGFVLAAGDCAGDARILAFAAGIDGDAVTTTARVQTSWSGGGMVEEFVTLPRTDGLTLENVYRADQDTPTSTLLEQGRTAVKYGQAEVVTRVVMHPDDTTLLMEQVTIGDIVTLAIKDGRVDVNQPYRITQIDLDPEFDQLSYVVAPEV